MSRALVFALGLECFTLWCGIAAADPNEQTPEDAAGAHALFSEGRELMKQGDVERACSKFEDSHRLRAGTGTLFNLADCWEKLGRSASAWAAFLDVAARAKRAEETAREAMARERAAALHPKLSRLTIRAARPVPKIERNGVLFGPAMLDTAVPVDPGDHRIRVTAPGKLPWEKTLIVEPGEQLSLDIPPLEDAPRRPSADAAPRPPLPQSKAAGSPPSREAPFFSQRTIGYAVGGAGVVALGVAVFFGLRTTSKNDEALSKCPGSICRDESERREHARLLDEAYTGRALSYASLAVSVSALAGGALLVVTAEPARSSRAVRVTGVAAPSQASLAVTGAF